MPSRSNTHIRLFSNRTAPRPLFDRVSLSSIEDECDAEIIVRPGVVWLEHKGLAITSNCLIQLSLVLERDAEIVVRLGLVRLDPKGLAITGNCIIQPSLVL